MTEAKPKKKAAARKSAAPAPRSARKESAAPIVAPTGPATGVHHLAPNPGSTQSRKRVGRGPGSGHGKTAGRGHKGQKSRSGYTHMRGFEGGQMPLHRRLPKRGFTNIFKKQFALINLGDLEGFDAQESVTPELLIRRGVVKRLGDGLKVLGDGDLKAPLTIRAHAFSKSALEKIQAAGGKAEVVSAKAVEA